MSVLVETTLGALVLDLFVEDCPLACTNFLKLCKTKYYHGCLFFNVQENFMVQAGDPTATGTGGDSIYGKLYGAQARFFEDELPKSKGRSHEDRRGLLGMASGSVNQNASQFYITTRAEDMAYLDGQHTIFGEVAEGMDVLDKINALFVDKDYRPYQDVRIKHTYVLDDPFPDPKGLDELIPPSSPTRERPEEEQVEPRLAADEKLDENEGRTEQEIEKAVREKEAKSRAVVLEMIGDLPDADVKPPEEVLFVCKLNPVTESADLDMAFCRFGPCKSEVIRDQKTGDSLCFAFVEFTDRRHCEEAYFKMNNVLLDDRRIKVDFSQSVSKLWNKVKRRPWEKPTKRDGDAYAKDRKSGGRDSRNGGGGRRELGGNLRLKSRGSDDFKLVEEEEAASSSRITRA
ncbi:Peptidyl-prolyl cis-trans isomerase [Phytophthora cactorum]|nr:Peptidyl-prolyl cis-trans isomerase [Phytophthora cactorum]KAG3000278.1 Peptidyl-prolyl cis-trans isomerase [Phytophthora cactorum]